MSETNRCSVQPPRGYTHHPVLRAKTQRALHRPNQGPTPQSDFGPHRLVVATLRLATVLMRESYHSQTLVLRGDAELGQVFLDPGNKLLNPKKPYAPL